MSERRAGICYALAAYAMWGVMPLYLKAVGRTAAVEVVAHRIFWSAILLVGVVAASRQLDWLRQVRQRPRVLWTFVASAAALTVNWLIYVWAAAAGRVIDASLGYFISPLVSVVLGVVVLKERPRAGQWAALTVASAGVLALSVHAGQLPWIGLTLGAAFAVYGLLRKMTSLDALGGLTLETVLLFPAAASYLIYLSAIEQSSWSAGGTGLKWLLVASGPVTAVPLWCFAAGARRIPLSLIGVLQYLGPSLQLGLGALVFHEPVSAHKFAGFAVIWLALALYAIEGALFRARGNADAVRNA